LRRKSSTVCSSARPVVVVPLRFSDRTRVQPAALSVAYWMSRLWSLKSTPLRRQN
jgi:hypothetical protein